MKIKGLLFLLCFLTLLSALPVDFSRVNLAWQYDLEAEVQMAHRVIQNGKSISVFLRIKADSLSVWDYEYLIQESYEAEKDRSFKPIKIDTLLGVRNQVLLRLDLPALEGDLFVIKVFRFEQFYYYDIGLKIGNLSYPSIYPTDMNGLPILEKYINKSGFKWQGSDTFLAMQYKESFASADPPMADMKPLAPSAKLEASFYFRDSVLFEEGSFYVIRSDSNASTGVTMLKTPPYFPEYRILTELVEAMFYLTSETERKTLLTSNDLKKDFDSFWVNNFNTKPRARNAIRRYYHSVETANFIFTDFKPGWKTDRGMMFIIFGAPNEVYRTNSLEEWYYDSGDFFEFTVISSFFAPRTYVLRREKALEETWFQHIAAIRQGIK